MLVALAVAAALVCAAAGALAQPAPAASPAPRALTAGQPDVTGIVPSQAAAGDLNFGITVVGSGFAPGATVLWNGDPRDTGFVSQNMLVATVLAADVATPGTAYVTVVNPGPGGGLSPIAGVFTVVNPPPVVTQLEPSAAWAGGPAVPVAVTGSGFMPTSVIQVAGSDVPTTYVSGERLEAVVPEATVGFAAAVNIRVFTPAPGGGLSAPIHLIVVADGEPPVTTVSGPAGLWHRTAVTLTLDATDVGLGVMKTFWRIGTDTRDNHIGTRIRIPAPADHSNDGIHRVQYYSVDQVANMETPKEIRVGIDTTPPKTSVSAAVVEKGGTYTPRYLIDDALSPRARDAVLQIVDASGRIVLRSSLGRPATRTLVKAPGLRVDLPAGTYRQRVLAHDLAGNAQAGTRTAPLVVR